MSYGFVVPSLVAVGDLVDVPNHINLWSTGLNELMNPPACRVFHNAAQSIAASTQTTLAFNSERFDTDSMHDTVTNNSRITFTTAGLYVVGANIEWGTDATSFRFAAIRQNGSTIIAQNLIPPAAGVATDQNLGCVYQFAAADYIEIRVQQNSAGAINVASVGNLSPEFWAARIGSGNVKS